MNWGTLEEIEPCIQMIWRHEENGKIRNEPYKDQRGFWTIGIGTCLEAFPLLCAALESGGLVEIDDKTAMVMFTSRIDSCKKFIDNQFPKLGNGPRKWALIDMVYNLGEHGFLAFRKTIEHIDAGNWLEASKEALNSKWAVQVGRRALEIAWILRNDRLMPV